MSLSRGRAAESTALQFLESQGLALVARNYRCRLGELDLVMRHGAELVFVEVRARAGESHGGGAGSVDAAKRRRLASAARHFLMRHPREARWPARFDVVVISGSGSQNAPRWIRAAFDCSS